MNKIIKRTSAARTPYENYELPPSSEKGVAFVDWNEVIKNVRINPHGNAVRVVKKKRGKLK